MAYFKQLNEVNAMKVLFLTLSLSLLMFASQSDARKRVGSKSVQQDVLVSIRNIKNMLQSNEVDITLFGYGTAITGLISL